MHLSDTAIIELKQIIVAPVCASEGHKRQTAEDVTLADFAGQLLVEEALMFRILNPESSIRPI